MQRPPNYPRARANILFLFLIFDGRKKKKKKKKGNNSKQKVRAISSTRNVSPFHDNTSDNVNLTVQRIKTIFQLFFLSFSTCRVFQKKTGINYKLHYAYLSIHRTPSTLNLLIIPNNHGKYIDTYAITKTDTDVVVLLGVSRSKRKKRKEREKKKLHVPA